MCIVVILALSLAISCAVGALNRDSECKFACRDITMAMVSGRFSGDVLLTLGRNNKYPTQRFAR